MLVATREHDPRANLFSGAPPRTALSRFTSGVQLLGSLIGIPLALVGGYATYHANFSAEAKCQALRANIITMLDKKTDASTLRLLITRDVVAFERDCDAVDADAVAAFKTLLAADKTAAHRAPPRSKADVASAKPAAAARNEPPAKAATKSETASKPAVVAAATPKADREDVLPEAQSGETWIARRDNPRVDASWIASVREALRESAGRQPAPEASADLAAPMPPPIVISTPVATGAALRKAEHPVPPAPIPDGGATAD